MNLMSLEKLRTKKEKKNDMNNKNSNCGISAE